ncbi:prepilin-type N-terminal cleavage/methylation domain-containing protein [bacterium]|nr:prepilin-type N-terminal cleavage/methylation domain-containing protein [bacterium]
MPGQRGFTLIELLIVVAIIGILAAIAVPNFLNAQIRARIAHVEADLKTLANAMEMYKMENNAYPIDAPNKTPYGLYMMTTPVPYLSTIPIDIFVKKAYVNPGTGEDVGPFYEMGTDTPYNNDQRVVYGAWAIQSAGPDGDDDTYPLTEWPFTTKFWDYDTSNGLLSSGDIFRLGGNYSHGTFIRNGRKN